MPACRARSRPAALATFEKTSAISPPSSPRRAESISACRLLPRPLMRTPMRPAAGATSVLVGDAVAFDHGADHEARLAAPLERVLDLVQVGGRDHRDHADAHVEGA